MTDAGNKTPDKPADAAVDQTPDVRAGADAAVVPGAPASAAGEPEVRGMRKGMFGGSLGLDTTGFGGLEDPIRFPGASARPYGGYFDEIGDALEAALPAYGDSVEKVVIDRGEMTVFVAREHLLEFVRPLRDDPRLRFEMGLGVSGVHYPDDAGRELHACYNFQSLTHGCRRLRVEVTCPEDDPRIPSIISVYPAMDWHERETWDMFGIIFTGRELTRILMPDDWPGHPQRKDYPLGGVPVEYKGAWVPAPDQRRSYN